MYVFEYAQGSFHCYNLYIYVLALTHVPPFTININKIQAHARKDSSFTPAHQMIPSDYPT